MKNENKAKISNYTMSDKNGNYSRKGELLETPRMWPTIELCEYLAENKCKCLQVSILNRLVRDKATTRREDVCI